MTHLTERLTEVERQIPDAQKLADAEASWLLANGASGGNPWSGASKRRDDLVSEARDIRHRIKGHELTAAHDELRRLDTELARLQLERDAADREVRERVAHPAVQKYLGAGSICRRHGWGHTFASLFMPWYESGRPRYSGLSEQAVFFLDSPDAKNAGVQFNVTTEREAVIAWNEARNRANLAMMAWNGAADRRQRLLRENPELKSAS